MRFLEYLRKLGMPKPSDDEGERSIVQLAGCLTAAEGWGIKPEHRAKREDYGWSPAYEAVLNLRLAFDKLAQGKSPEQVLGNLEDTQ